MIRLLLYLVLNILIYYFAVAELIEEATRPRDLESKRMKRAARTLKDPILGDRFPEFLQEVVTVEEGEGASQHVKAKQPRGVVFHPAWGIRGKDSIMGNTKLAKDRYIKSIPPVGYKNFVLEKDLEGNELLGAQAHVAVSASIFFCGLL